MTIFDYFKAKGIDTTNQSFYRKIEQWNSWYVSNVKGFTFYKIYGGQGTYTKKRRKSLGMAKTVCEDMANLLLNERVRMTISDNAVQTFVDSVLERNNFAVMANEYQERKAATGTIAMVPYMADVEVDEDGNIIHGTGSIKIDYVSAGKIFPTEWENGEITECIFAYPKTSKRKKYIQLAWHKIENELYVIENTVIECLSSGSEGWKNLEPDEWTKIKPFEGLAKRIETGSSEPQFVIDKLNIVNNADDDETNPMGVSIFANAIDTLMAIDTKYDSYCNEFDLGRKRIFVAPEMLENHDGSAAFDTNDSVFYKLPEGYSGDEGKNAMLECVDPQLRVEAHSKAINDELNYLSAKCGFGMQHYRFEGGQVRTATEVISENSDMYRTLKKHEIILESSLKKLIRIIVRLGNNMGVKLNEEYEITIDFDDSIIEDKTAERSTDRQDVAMGAMPIHEYRAKWYNEDEETARTRVGVVEDVIE